MSIPDTGSRESRRRIPATAKYLESLESLYKLPPGILEAICLDPTPHRIAEVIGYALEEAKKKG